MENLSNVGTLLDLGKKLCVNINFTTICFIYNI